VQEVENTLMRGAAAAKLEGGAIIKKIIESLNHRITKVGKDL